MTLDLEDEVTPGLSDGKDRQKPLPARRESEPAGAGLALKPRRSGAAVAPSPPRAASRSQKRPPENSEPHIGAARRSATAAKEAAARIRAQAAQYRVVVEPRPAPAPEARPAAPRGGSTAPAPAPESIKPEAGRASGGGEAGAAAAPAPPPDLPVPAAVAPSAEAAPSPPDATAEPAETVAGPSSRPLDQGQGEPVIARPKPASFSFKPMRQSPDTEAPFTTAYGFQSEIGSRSAGALLIGQVRPIRPAAPDRLWGADAPSEAAAPVRSPLRATLEASEDHDPADPEATASRFDRLSHEIAEQTRRLGFDPSRLGAGELRSEPEHASSPWHRLVSWLRGSS